MTPEDLEAWRVRRGWTRKRACEALGSCESSYTHYWRGRGSIPRTVELACLALDLTGGERPMEALRVFSPLTFLEQFATKNH
jgi:transcriptional regulator with XRE-family HTH domain